MRCRSTCAVHVFLLGYARDTLVIELRNAGGRSRVLQRQYWMCLSGQAFLPMRGMASPSRM